MGPSSTKVNTRKKNNTLVWFRTFVFFVVIVVMAVGIFFTNQLTATNSFLGSEFSTTFTATVGVYNNSENNSDTTIDNSVPNGDAKAAADVLLNKLNPLKNLPITVDIQGNNYLIVTAPTGLYNNNEATFRTNLQRSGGIFILDENYSDALFKSNVADPNAAVDKLKMSDVFSDAFATTVSTGSQNAPFLELAISNPSNLSSISTASTTDQSGQPQTTSKNLQIMTDADAYFDDLRKYYTRITSDDNALEKWWNDVIKQLRTYVLGSSQFPIIRDTLNDFFYGTYRDASGAIQQGSLLDVNFDLDPSTNRVDSDLENFKNIINSWEFSTEANKYIYDSNASTEDFTTQEGRYYTSLKKVDSPSQNLGAIPFGNIKEAFQSLSSSLIPLGLNFDLNYFAKYIIYAGTLDGTAPESGKAYVSNNELFIPTKTISIARNSEVVYKTAGRGFSFHVFFVNQEQAQVTNAFKLIFVVVIGIVLGIILVFLLFMYRLLGFITILIAALIASLTLALTVWFKFAIGADTVAVIFIITAITIDICVTLFERMKENIFVLKRPVKQSFAISNRDTLAFSLDTLVIILIPNVALFWLGESMLKSFSTLLTLGILFSIVISLLVGRLLFSLIVNSKYFQKNPERLFSKFEFNPIRQFSINYKIEKLLEKKEKIEASGKKTDNLTSINAKLQILKDKQKVKENKLRSKVEGIVANLQKKQASLQNKPKALLRLDSKIADYQYLLSDSQIEDIEYVHLPKVIDSSYDVLKRKEHAIKEKVLFKVSWISNLVFVMLIILGVIVGLGFGINWDVSFGNGSRYIVWGEYVENIYDQTILDVSNIQQEQDGTYLYQRPGTGIVQSEEPVAIPEYVVNYAIDLKTSFDQSAQSKLEKVNTVISFLNFLFVNPDVINVLTGNSVDAGKSKAYGGTDYRIAGSEADNTENQVWVAFTTNLVNPSSRIDVRNMLISLAHATSLNGNIVYPEMGIEALSIEPHSSVQQMKELAWTLLAALIALLVYILIRFKWTYYVAIALSLILSLGVTLALVVLFRIPLTYSLFAAAISLNSFNLIFISIVMSYAKNQIKSRNQKSLEIQFQKEIEIGLEIQEFKYKLKQKKHELKKLKQLEIKKIKKENPIKDKALKQKIALIKIDFRKNKSSEIVTFKKTKKELKQKIAIESRKNNYLKEILAKIISYTNWRMFTILPMYLVIALVITATLPSLFSFGLVMLIGLVLGMFSLYAIAIPIWILLETLRIRNRLTIKKFIKNLQISSEEQYVENINY